MKYWIQSHQVGRFPSGRSLAEFAKLSEDLGFEAVCLPDHIIFPRSHEGAMGRPWPEQLVLAAYLAGQTSTLRFHTAATVATQRNPMLLAKQAATIDFVSDGRFALNLAVGWLEEEFEWLGYSPRNRGKRLDEYIELIRALLTTDPVSFEGEEFQFADASFHPKPIQDPMPLYVGGSPLKSPRRAARLGDGWAPSGGSFDEFKEGLGILKDELAAAGRSFEGYPAVPELLAFDLPEETKEHFRDTGTEPPESLESDYDRIQARVAEYEALGIERCMIFPARFGPEELPGELRRFAEVMIG